MKINRNTLAKNYIYDLEEEIDFSSFEFKSNVRKVDKTLVKAKVVDYKDILRIEVEVKTTVTAICSYTLEDVILPIHFKDELDFSDDENEIEQYFYLDKQIFELDPYILGLILSNVPDKVIKKGAKLPSGGDGYRVLSEEEFIKERSTKTDSRWDKLDELELD